MLISVIICLIPIIAKSGLEIVAWGSAGDVPTHSDSFDGSDPQPGTSDDDASGDAPWTGESDENVDLMNLLNAQLSSQKVDAMIRPTLNG
jgi:hypothetical protein